LIGLYAEGTPHQMASKTDFILNIDNYKKYLGLGLNEYDVEYWNLYFQYPTYRLSERAKLHGVQQFIDI